MSVPARRCRARLLLLPGLLAASACSRPPQHVAPPQPAPPADVFNYQEHELSHETRANIDHEIVLHLESSAEAAQNGRLLAATSHTVVNRVYYRVEHRAAHEFCIDPGDPLIVGLALHDATDKELLSMAIGEPCSRLRLETGDYTLTVLHEGRDLSTRGRKAFVHRTNKPRLWTTASSGTSSSPVSPDEGYLAIQGAGGRLLYADNAHPQGNCCSTYPSTDSHYAVVVKADPAAQLFGQWSLWKVVNTSAGQALTNYQLPTLDAWDQNTLVPGSCQAGSGEHLYLQDWTPFCSKVYDSTYYKSWVKLSGQHVTDLGNYQFNMGHTLWSYTPPGPDPTCLHWCSDDGYSYEHVQYGTTPDSDHLVVSSEAVAAPSGFSSTFKVLYKYYEDASKVPELQPGEVALYSSVNYGGAPGEAWVFVADADFTSGLGGMSASNSPDNIISSIKAGPGTGVDLFADPGFKNLLLEDLYGDVPDLGHYTDPKGTPHSLDNVVSSIRVRSLRSVLISSRDCAYCNLTGVDLSGQDLTGVNLRQAVLDTANLQNTDWAGATLTGASLKNADLSGAKLTLLDATDADFSGAKLAAAVFTIAGPDGATPPPGLRRARFKEADLEGTSFVGVNLSGTDFSHAHVQLATFDATPIIDRDFTAFGTSQWRTSFAHGMLGSGNFSPATWRYLDLTGTALKVAPDGASPDVSGVDLRGALISGADFTGFVLDGARFGCPDGVSGTAAAPCIDLSNARFLSASLKGVDLTGAILRGASFNNADLTGATLRAVFGDDCSNPTLFEGAYLLDVDLQDAQLNCARMAYVSLYQYLSPTPPSLVNANFTQADLSSAILSGLDLSNAKLDRATLADANLVHTSLHDASLRSATLTRAFLQGADLTGADLTALPGQTAGASLDKATVATTAGEMAITVVLQDGSTESDVFAYDATTYLGANTDDSTTCPNTAPATITGPCSSKIQWEYPTPATPECVPKPSTDPKLVRTCPRPR